MTFEEIEGLNLTENQNVLVKLKDGTEIDAVFTGYAKRNNDEVDYITKEPIEFPEVIYVLIDDKPESFELNDVESIDENF